MALLTTTADLAAFCGRIECEPYVTVDTEFMRERTFWPRLCLVQVAGAEEAHAIDPLAPGIDLAPLFALLADARVLKVFHAARQDLEIFFHLTGGLPEPIFDTQIAAMVCGFGDQVGYETLIARTTRAQIDKSARFTDWSLRPLSDRQVTYALSDVTHLRGAYEKLERRLTRSRRAEWVGEEMAHLIAPSTYAIDPAQAFRRIKTRNARPRMLAVLRELGAWREHEAQRIDIPRGRVARDETLLEIAHHAPATPEDLARTRGLPKNLAAGAFGRQILEAVQRGLAVPDADCPPPEIKESLPQGIGPVVELLRVLLKMRCDSAGVAQRLVASSDDLELIAARGEAADVDALSGWRREVFGEDALKLRRGETALALDEGGRKLRVVPLAEGTPVADAAPMPVNRETSSHS